MKLSIWPNANAHPANKKEKQTEAFKFSAPNLPETVEFDNEDGLINLVTNNCWSPFVFSGHRHKDNFVSCDLLVYDIDEGLTIDEAQKKVKQLGLACLCLPSPSHSEEAHRFRIILPLERTIFDTEVYVESWLKGAAIFGVVDEQCKDLARAYFGSTTEDGFWEEGTFFEPVAAKEKPAPVVKSYGEVMLPVTGDIDELVHSIYGEKRTKLPEAVDYFLRNAHTGMPGEWTNSLSRFSFSLALSGVDKEIIIAVCEELAPEPLDSKDMYQINKAVADAKAEL